MTEGKDLIRPQNTQGDLNPPGRDESFGIPCLNLFVRFFPGLRHGSGEDPLGILE